MTMAPVGGFVGREEVLAISDAKRSGEQLVCATDIGRSEQVIKDDAPAVVENWSPADVREQREQ